MLSEIRAGAVTIRGVSVGGIYTALHIPEYDVALDVGLAPRSFAGVRTLLLSHGHVDHAGALSTLLGIRALQGHPSPLRVIMPAEIVDHVVAALEAMSVLQHWPLRIDPIGLRHGDEFAIRPDLLVRAQQAFHVVPCLAYQFIRRVRKLKPEYQHLSGDEIARRRLAGEDLFRAVEHLEFAYATDTLVTVLDHNPQLYESRVLVIETTFLDGRKSLLDARAGCHIHLDEIIERAERFENRHLVFMHVSQIYSPAEVEALLDARLPPGLRARTQVLVPGDATRWPG